MFKTVAAKTLALVAFATTGFVLVCCLLLYSNMKRDQIEESILHANDISSVVLKATRHSMMTDDRGTLRNIVTSVNEESLVEHVRIFNKKGVIVFSGIDDEVGRKVDARAEGCAACHSVAVPVKNLGPMEQARRFVSENGEPVLAITAAIYNGPECSNAQCHNHLPQQAVLGTLDIGLSEAPLQKSLDRMGKRLAIFSTMLLFLIVGAVAALLQMHVIKPLETVVAYMHAVASGHHKPAPPPLGGEFDAVVDAVRKTKERMDKPN
jgi:hypothetical protein